MTTKLVTAIFAMTLGVVALGHAAGNPPGSLAPRPLPTITAADWQRDFALRQMFPDPKPVTGDGPVRVHAAPAPSGSTFNFLAGGGG